MSQVTEKQRISISCLNLPTLEDYAGMIGTKLDKCENFRVSALHDINEVYERFFPGDAASLASWYIEHVQCQGGPHRKWSMVPSITKWKIGWSGESPDCPRKANQGRRPVAFTLTKPRHWEARGNEPAAALARARLPARNYMTVVARHPLHGAACDGVSKRKRRTQPLTKG